jgi:hypothetical protein
MDAPDVLPTLKNGAQTPGFFPNIYIPEITSSKVVSNSLILGGLIQV